MIWELVPTEDFSKVLELYQKVFEDSLSIEEYRQRTETFEPHLYLIKHQDEAPIGFGIYLGKGRDVELWHCGVIPERRRQGAGKCLLEKGEIKMAECGYSRLKVCTFNRWNIMISILAKRGYRIVDTKFSRRRKDVKINFVLELVNRKEIRYALTEKCNFKCLFCHNEGLGHNKRERIPDEKISNIINEAIRLGYTDITFTGGEPLLEKERLYFLLERLGQLFEPPDVTVVTNGSLLTNRVIDCLVGYPGKCKLHLSLHATDEQTFKKITCMPRNGMFQTVKENVRKASSAGLTVKVNYVVLQQINHNKLLDAIELARSMDAKAIKFLELLVLPENSNDYSMYYDLHAIESQIEMVADGPEQTSMRQLVYYHKGDSRFKIEIQRLTCALGCSHCLEVRDRTFSSDMCYHPCFVRHKSHYPIETAGSLKQRLLDGDRIINGYAARYGDSSPTLVQKEQFVSGKREFFYRVENPHAFREFIRKHQYVIRAKHAFHEEYYWPMSRQKDWEQFKRVLKIGWDYHDQSKIDLIYTDHEYKLYPEIGMETITHFLFGSGPMRFDTAEIARHFLNSLDFVKYLELEWELETWERGSLTMNLSLSGNRSTVKLFGPLESLTSFHKLFSLYEWKLEPLKEPLVEFMLQQQERSTIRMK